MSIVVVDLVMDLIIFYLIFGVCFAIYSEYDIRRMARHPLAQLMGPPPTMALRIKNVILMILFWPVALVKFVFWH